MNILHAIDDPKVFGQHFRGGTWDVWRVFLAALFGLPLTPDQLALYQTHTGRTTPPTTPLHEAWLVCGRRAGKSFILAVVAVFLACFKDWRWRRSRTLCCYARLHRTPAVAPYGTHTASILPKTAIPCWCGKLPRAICTRLCSRA